MYATLIASARAVTASRALAEAHPAGALSALVDQVCAEAGVYAPAVARSAIDQADGDVQRAVTLLRVWAATLPVLEALPIADDDVRLHRRISSAFADVPGGQWLGAAPQLLSRLMRWPEDEAAAAEDGASDPADTPTAAADASATPPSRAQAPRVADLLAHLPVHGPPPEPDGPDPVLRPLTTSPITRGARLAALARGETGALVALANLGHAGAREEVLAEASTATATVRVPHPRTGRPVAVAEVPVSQAETISDTEVDGRPGFVIGYGATLGRGERRAIAASILDGAMQCEAGGLLSEGTVMAAIDGLATGGFVEHLCLPHYASFASYLDRVADGAEATALEEPADDGR